MFIRQTFFSAHNSIEHRRHASKNPGGLGAGPQRLLQKKSPLKTHLPDQKEFKNVFFESVT
jgi:hypothetical protein